MRFFPRTSVDFIGKRYIWYTVSATLILLGLITVAFRGLNYGIDFKGGTELTLNFDPAPNIGAVRSSLDKIGFGDAEIKTFGRCKPASDSREGRRTRVVTGDKIIAQLKSSMPNTQIQLLQENKIGPKIGQELRQDAVMAIFYSWIAILIYVSLRFQFIYAVGAVLASVHDVSDHARLRGGLWLACAMA